MAARAGEIVERELRAISVPQFALWRDVPGAQDVHFRIACSKGTYIRTLVHDLVRRAIQQSASVRGIQAKDLLTVTSSIGTFSESCDKPQQLES